MHIQTGLDTHQRYVSVHACIVSLPSAKPPLRSLQAYSMLSRFVQVMPWNRKPKFCRVPIPGQHPRARRRRGANGFESLAKRTVARRRSKKWLRNSCGNCPGYGHFRVARRVRKKTLRNVVRNSHLKKEVSRETLRNRLASEPLRRNEPLSLGSYGSIFKEGQNISLELLKIILYRGSLTLLR